MNIGKLIAENRTPERLAFLYENESEGTITIAISRWNDRLAMWESQFVETFQWRHSA